MIFELKQLQSPLACIRWMGHGIQDGWVRGVLVRRLGCYRYGEMLRARMLHPKLGLSRSRYVREA
jgi:hypothetical protein